MPMFLKRFFLLFFSIVGCLFFLNLEMPLTAHAQTQATAQLALAGTMLGHPGTKVQINGSGFDPASQVSLYTTPNPDPTKCLTATDPVAAGLTPFTTSPSVTPQGTTGTIAVSTTWPTNAATATTAYYICALSTTVKAFSSNTFTVAQPVTIDAVTPTSVVQGGQVTITGSNWVPAQSLDVAILTGNTAIAENKSVQPDTSGKFSVTLTIPADAAAQSYNVSVTANNEQTPAMTLAQNNALTVTQAAAPTPTPTPVPSPTPSPTATPAPSPTPTTTASPPNGGNTNGGGGNTGITYLIFTLGGIGILLVIVGAVLYFVYSPRPTV